MGFTRYEKERFRNSMREKEKILVLLETEYPDDVIQFLKSQALLKQVRDYCIMSDKPKFEKAENIVVTYLLNSTTSVYGILEEWQTFLSPPVSSFIYYLKS